MEKDTLKHEIKVSFFSTKAMLRVRSSQILKINGK